VSGAENQATTQSCRAADAELCAFSGHAMEDPLFSFFPPKNQNLPPNFGAQAPEPPAAYLIAESAKNAIF
jgi:hypothetical protein